MIWEVIVYVQRCASRLERDRVHFSSLLRDNFYLAVQRLSHLSRLSTSYLFSSFARLASFSRASVTSLARTLFAASLCRCSRLLYYSLRRSPAAPFVLTFTHLHFSSLHFNNASCNSKLPSGEAFSTCEWISPSEAEVIKRKLRCFERWIQCSYTLDCIKQSTLHLFARNESLE